MTIVTARNVVLLHGIWNTRLWLAPLAARLRGAGFAPRVFGYASVFGGLEQALPQLIQALRDAAPTHLLGHSLGGMVALEALRRAPDLPVARVVCLGTPLRGSATARWLSAHPVLGKVLGRSAHTLCQAGFSAWDGVAEVGMVAGDVPRGLGRLVRAFDDVSDGTVRVAETHVAGLSDHIVVPASHSGLVLSAEAARQASAFLTHGRFDRGL